MRRGGAAAIVAGLVGGLVLAASSTASWVVEEDVRDVAGVQLEEEQSTPGIELAPHLVTSGLAATVVALAIAALPRRWRRAGGGLLALAGLAGAAAAGLGLARALEAPGAVAGGPAVAFAGVLAVLAAAGLLLRTAIEQPLLDEDRYTVEGVRDAGDDEWDLASTDEDEG